MTEITEKPIAREKLFNVPPFTFWLALLIIVVHLARLISPAWDAAITAALAFVPAQAWQKPWTMLGYTLLHGNWLHLGINLFGLLAFGSGVERFYGRIWLAIFFIGGTLCGVGTHALLFSDSLEPLAGASAGISALFGAVLLLIAAGRGLFAGCLVFVVTNIALGMTGMPDQPDIAIAWQAHLGGFAFGLAAALLVIQKRRAMARRFVAVTED